MPTDLALLVFVKYPEPGKVKTRLAATVGAKLAAELYREFIRYTLSLVLKMKTATATATGFVTFTPANRAQQLKKIFPGPWHWFAQIDSNDLGVRIQHAISHVLQCGYSRVLTIGSDSPSLPVAYLREAAEALSTHDLVLGQATDGGYYLIGIKSSPPALFTGIDWSTAAVLQQTLQRAEQLRMSVHQLPVWYDVDDLPALRRFCVERQLAPALWEQVKQFVE